ncbi:hypothetical protein HYZ97_05155 [Candidatus Pacearchaeota archaeon]|nr:hypothetical protein [Candidatus Pacearchaeota archaeon]
MRGDCMQRRGIAAPAFVLFCVLILVAAVGAYFLVLKPGLNLAPGDGVCDEGEEDDADCYPTSEEPEYSEPVDPECSGIASGESPDPEKPEYACVYCNAEGALVNVAEGEDTLGGGYSDQCSYCKDGKVEYENEGVANDLCTKCSGGKEVKYIGNFPWDPKGTECYTCTSTGFNQKPAGEACTLEYVYELPDKTQKEHDVTGQCNWFPPYALDEPVPAELSYSCSCSTLECQPGQLRNEKPIYDPINDQKGYQSCLTLFEKRTESTNADGEVEGNYTPLCTVWPPKGVYVTPCDTCSEDFDAVNGCKKISKEELKKRAKVGYACKYKSFWTKKVKPGLCTSGGSCSGLKLLIFSFTIELNDKVNEVAECNLLAKKKGINLGDGWSLEVSKYEETVKGKQKTTYQCGFKKVLD